MLPESLCFDTRAGHKQVCYPRQPPPLIPPRSNTPTPPQPLLSSQRVDSFGRVKARIDDKETVVSCQGVKMFLIKNLFKIDLPHKMRFVIVQVLSQFEFFSFVKI